MWTIYSDLRNAKFILEKESTLVEIPYSSIDLLGFESSQEHEDPIGLLSEPDSLTLVFEGVEYEIPSYGELDNDTREILLEWFSPT
jgi:hypothetical protein